MSKSTILFVFEGEKTEKQITDNFTQYFVNENTNVQCAFCSDVYQLYNKICLDPDLDTFSILKNRPQNSTILANFKRSDFAEIYMFFDYDGHAPKANNASISDLAQFFNEETDTGKIYFSYPMVEAIKHVSSSIDFKNLKVSANTNINYKGIVGREGSKYLRDLSNLTETHWQLILKEHLKKMNFIVNDHFILPNSIISQSEIFKHQLTKYIQVDSTISVLSGFPIFIFDYYGHERTVEIIDGPVSED